MVLKNIIKYGKYQRKSLKFDISAGIVLFLVAIPLCLGIALASNAPILSGIIAAIIGGIIVGFLSSSNISVTGPTPAMAAFTILAIGELQGFNVFLLALLFAGIFQILLGIIRSGFIAEYLPYNVIQGVLCAIGILLIIKQLPFTFTTATNLVEMKQYLLEMTEVLTTHDLFTLSYPLNTGAIIISLVTISILIAFDNLKKAKLKISGPIIAILFAFLLNELFIYFRPDIAQQSLQLIFFPDFANIKELSSILTFPDFSAITNPKVFIIAILLSFVASMESLISIKAIKRLTKNRHYVSIDRELASQGVGNLTSGILGGLPMTVAIIQSSINNEARAKSKLATIIHGVLILLTIFLFPEFLNRIPISALATILVYTGYKLTKPSIYVDIFKQGIDRSIPFIATIIGILIFNLMIGLTLGLILSLFFILKSNSQVRLDIIQEHYPSGVTNRLILPQHTTFLNKASIVAELQAMPQNSQLIIDARYADYIDKEIIEFIKLFKEQQASKRKISINLIGFKDSYDIHDYIDFINVTTYDIQSALTPEEVLVILKEGNQRFLNDTNIHRSTKIDIKYTAKTQHPIAVILACIDSRVPVETIFDMSFGDIFCIRIAGNIINDDILASIEFATAIAKAKLIVVLGHTGCGAISAACDDVETGHMTQLLKKIKPAINAETTTTSNRSSKNLQFVSNVTEFNIANTLLEIYNSSGILQTLIKDNTVAIVGAVYDIKTGEVRFENFADRIKSLAPKTPDILLKKLLPHHH